MNATTTLRPGVQVRYCRSGTLGTVTQTEVGVTVSTAYGTDWMSYRHAAMLLAEVAR